MSYIKLKLYLTVFRVIAETVLDCELFQLLTSQIKNMSKGMVAYLLYIIKDLVSLWMILIIYICHCGCSEQKEIGGCSRDYRCFYHIAICGWSSYGHCGCGPVQNKKRCGCYTDYNIYISIILPHVLLYERPSDFISLFFFHRTGMYPSSMPTVCKNCGLSLQLYRESVSF